MPKEARGQVLEGENVIQAQGPVTGAELAACHSQLPACRGSQCPGSSSPWPWLKLALLAWEPESRPWGGRCGQGDLGPHLWGQIPRAQPAARPPLSRPGVPLPLPGPFRERMGNADQHLALTRWNFPSVGEVRQGSARSRTWLYARLPGPGRPLLTPGLLLLGFSPAPLKPKAGSTQHAPSSPPKQPTLETPSEHRAGAARPAGTLQGLWVRSPPSANLSDPQLQAPRPGCPQDVSVDPRPSLAACAGEQSQHGTTSCRQCGSRRL